MEPYDPRPSESAPVAQRSVQGAPMLPHATAVHFFRRVVFAALIDRIVAVRSSLDRHSGWFSFLATAHRAAKKFMYQFLCGHPFSFLLGIYVEENFWVI